MTTRARMASACVLFAASLTADGAEAARAAAAERGTAPRIPYEKFVLDNGMVVVLHEDHSLPAVVVNVWYGVGSKDESPGRSGFAHLFEHLMFMGTERVPGADFDVLMEQGGGRNNASTANDRTNYYSTGPSELLPLLLWLEADRMEELGRAMTQDKLDKQREVVRNERRQNVENRPYGKADVVIDEFMFPEGHPYHVSVIGRHEDLQAATLGDVVSFFDRFYVPSNASLVVAGDFDPAQVRPLVQQLFGTLESKPTPAHGKAAPVRLPEALRATLRDDVKFPRVSLLWHSPPRLEPGDVEMDVLAAILSDGKGSRLYRRLVREERLCTGVAAYQESRELGSLFHVHATCDADADLDRVQAIVDEEVEDLRVKGPSAGELQRAQAGLERRLLSQLESLLDRADLLNTYEHQRGEPDSLAWDLDRLRSVTSRSVRDWARRVLVPERLDMRVLPAEGNPRDQRPGPAPASAYSFAEPASFELSNGLAVHHWPRPDLPLFALRLVVPGGAARDVEGRAGRTRLLMDLISEGTTRRSAAEMAEALELLGADLDASAAREHASVSLSGLARTWPEALALFAEAIAEPALSAEDFDRVRQLASRARLQAEDDPQQVATVVAGRLFFGEGHPYGEPADGDPDTLARLTLDDVRSLHASTFRPDRVVLLASGQVTAEELRGELERLLGSWSPPANTPAPPVIAIEPARARPFETALVHRAGAVQTVTRFTWPSLKFGDPERIPLDMVNTILGATFTSRLNANLREAHGYTYGASSRVMALPSTGYHVASAAVRTDVTGAALVEFFRELDRMAAGEISQEDRDKAASSIRSGLVEQTQGLAGLLATAENLLVNDLPFSTFDRWLGELDTTSLEQLRDVARRRVAPRSGLLVLVGDRAQITPQLKSVDVPSPREADVRGRWRSR